jgi:O-antigen ligase
MLARNGSSSGFFSQVRKPLPILLALVCLILIGVLSVFQPLGLVLSIFFLLYLLLAISKFEWLLLLTVLAFPLIPFYIGFDFKGMAIISPQRVLIFGLYIAWLLKKLYRGEKVIIKTPINLGLALFLLVRILGVVFSLNFGVSLSRYLSQFFTFYLIYFLVLDSIISWEQINRVLRVLVASGVVVGLLGIVEFATKFNIYSYLSAPRATFDLTASHIQSRMGLVRIEGALGHSIVMGMFLSLVIPICLGQLVAAQSRRRKTWLLACLLVSTGAILTFSRATWIGLCFILLAFTLRYPRHFAPYVCVILIAATVGILGLSQSRQVRTFIERTTESKKKADLAGSTAQRIKQIQIGIPTALQRPLTGYGIDHAKRATGLRTIDNYYLTLILESGVASLTAFLLLMFLVLYQLKKVIQGAPDFEVRNLAFSIFVSLTGFMIILATVSLTQDFFIWWILAALGMRMVMNEKEKRSAL